ncbi:hypothetical protein M407DRAFT_125227 [Tulasnella calospora MUT 4182]|uniref:Extracellular membrane protein CFEM domain-containing protein n=1 Tax=Tulasnella calospora MUT 4182 TaxID=1051891 RepID=A0A0C3QA17_9AGAM|nr:hypothetical protein M407DRAFT_125227 [Tulasnella calospora MUT 4182]
MHSRTLLSTIPFFIFVSATPAAATLENAASALQVFAPSHHLSARQTSSGDYGPCNDQCKPVDSKIASCGADGVCLCSSDMSTQYHSCVQCCYDLAVNGSLKSQVMSYYTNYVSDCGKAGHPIQGDTTISETTSSSSASSASSTSSSSKSNGASSSTSYSLATVGLGPALLGLIASSSLF